MADTEKLSFTVCTPLSFWEGVTQMKIYWRDRQINPEKAKILNNGWK